MNQTYMHYFFEVVKRFPNKTAIGCDNISVTYAELDKSSRAIASKLVRMGICDGEIVLIDLERGIATVEAMLGVLYAGGAVCMLAPDCPEARRSFIIADTGAKIIIDTAWLTDVDGEDAELPELRPEAPALIVYTSDSTGNPKGVINSHRTLMDTFSRGETCSAELQTMLRNMGISTSDMFSLVSPENPVAKQECVITKAADREDWPLTFAERQMATEQSLNPDSISYNINFLFKLNADESRKKFHGAIEELSRKHRILRSYYPLVNGEYVHRIAENINIEISEDTCADYEEWIDAHNVPFDLSRAPLYRCSLLKTADGMQVLHFCFHHIIMDAGSSTAWFDDLMKAYRGEEITAPKLDYLDHAVHQAEHSNLETGEAAMMNMFSGGAPENDMPTHPIRPEELPPTDCEVKATVSATDIKAVSERYGVTSFGVLMGALGITLAKYCGSEDVVIGTAMSGRTMREQENMIGMFVNTLPVRLKPAYDKSIADYLTETANTIRMVKANQTYPFERLVPILAPERNTSRSPVFDVLMNYLTEHTSFEKENLALERLPMKRQRMHMDMVVEAIRTGGNINIEISFSESLYDKRIIKNFLEQYTTVLGRIINGEAECVADVAELPEAQRRQLLEDFHGVRTGKVPDYTVIDLFREQMRRVPENRAVVFGEKTFTYRELDKLTDALAAHLVKKGIGSGSVVGIIVRRGLMMPVGALGVLKAGAAYLPLDPSYPSERLEFMLADAGADIVIGDAELRANIPGFTGEFLESSTVYELPAVCKAPVAPVPNDLFILLYTSGTTGKPKGVELTHGNILNYMEFYAKLHNICNTDNIPAYASFGFDAHMMDMYPTLMNGACLHIIPEEMRLDLPGLRDYFEENNVTVAFMTTQLGRQFAESMQCSTLRALSVGGEALVPIEPPTFELYNLYGPTECTIASNYFKVDKLYDRVPIGKATDNTAVIVTDKRGSLSPVGVAGELCIAGRQVGRGYLGRSDLTAEKFVKNPFTDDPEYSRMYKTGDVVRYLPTGDIDFVGRRDFQVKIRGFRIELTEIEGRIREYDGITDATVIAVDNPAGGKSVVAYIVANESVDIKKLNAFIEEELPAYMVPSATMQIDAIPLTPNGKVDRRKLPSVQVQAEEIVPPRTQMEKLVLEVARDILKSDGFGITTDLMYAGLTSLSSIKAAAIITERTGKKLTTAQIMHERTAEKIAALLDEGEAYEARTFEKRNEYPLTTNQLGVYFACIKEPELLIYNTPCVLNVKTEAKKLAEGFHKVIEAHSYIKMHFTLKNNQPMQLRRDDAEAQIDIVKCSDEEYETRKSNFVRPFTLFDSQLFRIEIYDTPSGVYALVDFHHIIFDGGSMNIFLSDLCAAISGAQLVPETFTSFDLSALEAEKSDQVEQDKAFWHERLFDMEGATQLPTDGEGTGHPVSTYARISKSSVDTLIKGHHLTPASLFLGASALALGRFASVRDIRFATISNCRDDVQLQRNLGMLVKTLPVCIKTSSELSAKDYLKEVHHEFREVLAHTSYSYMQASSDYNFNTQVLYAFQGGVISQFEVDGAPVHLEPLALNRVKFPIELFILEDVNDYVVQVQYDEGLFDDKTMQALGDCIAHTAGCFALRQDELLKNICISTSKQRENVASFQPQRTQLTCYESLHSIFEAHAQQTPDAVALVACDRTYTFRELDERANALAHSLVGLGAKQGDKVAFILPRDGRILVSMIGIMKAGCCYIPVDPAYPEDRILHVLEDSGACLILTDGKRDIQKGICIDGLISEGRADSPSIPVHREDLAYIIYTSGSTGKPKGVMLTHGGIINYVADTEDNRHVRALVENACVMASVTTVSFDMFLKEAFTTLMNGLTLVLADDEEAKNPDKLALLMQRTGATAFSSTPSRMLQYMQLEDMRKALGNCKVILAGGEGYPPMLYKKLREITDAVLINTYGPTEITVSSNGKLLCSEKITVGAPLANVIEEVRDIEGQPLPVGVTGELWIGGDGVARGYCANPEMTAERFVEYEGRRYYKSGDLARWTEDGEIVILGRNDGQIKLRGLRIELGEIENALGDVPEINACAVVVRKINKQEHLCAYYTADVDISPDELREKLLRSLTKYMVPTAYLQMEALPMTPNGKIDRKALPEASLMRREEYELPSNEAEAAYCEMFAEVLSLERVGATDNFFDIGGTSLLVTQLTVEAGERGIAISYSDVFSNPTPRELAALGSSTDVAKTTDNIADYDYSDIHAMLEENTIEELRKGSMRELGNVCITGATGFLGIHVLKEFIDSEKGAAYCVVRSSRMSAEKRLKNALAYYFSDSFDRLFGSRIIVVDGDITNPAVFETLHKYPVDTYINCAANVKHFSVGTDIEDINVGGVVNGVEFAKEKGCRFIQVSTHSVAGMSVDGIPDEDAILNENKLYFGQDLSNKYVNSKFLAERIILEETANGLDAKIMRVGNLMARASDGEFQMNFRTNGFLSRLNAYHLIGYIPYNAMISSCEFAPIDFTAKAVLLLAKTPEKCRVFHPYNDHDIFMRDVIGVLNNMGIEIKPCETSEFEKFSSEAFMDKDKASKLSSLIAYQEHGKVVRTVKSSNTYTSEALMRLGFAWPITTPEYLEQFFDMVRGLGFFEKNDMF